MTDPKNPVPGLRSLLEDTLGMHLDDDMKRRLESKLGTTIDDDPGRWAEVNRSLAIQAGEDPDTEGIVDTVVDRLEDELGEATTVPAGWSADERAIFATRAVEGAIEDDGPEGLRTVPRPWIEEAIAGYRHLGLASHADVTAKIAAALEGTLSADDVDDLMEDWLNEPNADGTRADWIRAHPEAFPA